MSKRIFARWRLCGTPSVIPVIKDGCGPIARRFRSARLREMRHRISSCRIDCGANSVSGFHVHVAAQIRFPRCVSADGQRQGRPSPAGSSRCDSLRGFHVFSDCCFTQSVPTSDSRSAWPRGLALGAPGDCWRCFIVQYHGALDMSTAFCSARNLDRHWLRRLAVGDGARICRVLVRAPAGCSMLRLRQACFRLQQRNWFRSCRPRVEFGFLGISYVTFRALRCRVLPARQGHRCARHARFLDVPIFLPNHFCRPDRPVSGVLLADWRKRRTRAEFLAISTARCTRFSRTVLQVHSRGADQTTLARASRAAVGASARCSATCMPTASICSSISPATAPLPSALSYLFGDPYSGKLRPTVPRPKHP